MIREIEGIKEFLSFLRKAGVESSVFYVLGNRPAVAVKTAKISNPNLKVESGIFEDEDDVNRLSLSRTKRGMGKVVERV